MKKIQEELEEIGRAIQKAFDEVADQFKKIGDGIEGAIDDIVGVFDEVCRTVHPSY